MDDHDAMKLQNLAKLKNIYHWTTLTIWEVAAATRFYLSSSAAVCVPKIPMCGFD